MNNSWDLPAGFIFGLIVAMLVVYLVSPIQFGMEQVLNNKVECAKVVDTWHCEEKKENE